MGPVEICLIVAGGIAVLTAAVYLFAVLPAARKHKDRKILEGLCIAHRGLHDVENDNHECFPENSLPAFEAAAEKGYAIENDIHLTKDGRVVVFHDDSLLRMCGVDEKPENLTLEEIKKLKLGKSEESVPTLEECLDTVKGRVPLLIEFKTTDRGYLMLCEKAEKILKNYSGVYWIQSFYPPVLGWYKKNRPEIMRGQLSTAFRGEALSRKMLGALFFNFMGRPDFISYEYTFADRFPVKLCRMFGCPLALWTLRSREEADKYKDAGNAYIFERFYMKKE